MTNDDGISHGLMYHSELDVVGQYAITPEANALDELYKDRGWVAFPYSLDAVKEALGDPSLTDVNDAEFDRVRVELARIQQIDKASSKTKATTPAKESK